MNDDHFRTDADRGPFAEGGGFHLLAKGFSSGVWRVDGEGRTVFCNGALAMMLGCTEDEMRGVPLVEFFEPEDREGVLSAVRQGALLRSLRQRLRPRRGPKEGRWFRLEVLPTANVPGGGPGAFLIVADTTAQRRAEESQAFLETLVETTGDAVFLTDMGHAITTWNRGAERLYGYTAEEAVGRDAGMLIPTEKMGETHRFLERLEAGETIADFECVAQRRDGTRFTILLGVTPVFGPRDEIVGHANVARDLTATRKAEELQARLAAIVESSDDAIVSKDLDGVVQTWNRAAERIFGYRAEEIVGRSITLLLPEDRLPEEADILRILRGGGRVDHFLTQRRTKDGRLIDVSVTVSPLRNAQARVVGASKVARDVTELMDARRERERSHAEMERRVEERTRELQAALAEMEGFAIAASHDLQAPLRTVETSARLIEANEASVLSDEARDLLGRQTQATARMNRLVTDLLDYARFARTTIDPREIDLSRTVRSVWDEITRDAPRQGLEVTIEPDLRAWGDPTLVRFVLQNLLQNAMKFSPGGGTVRVGQDAGGAFVVSDEGVGFDMQYAANLFQPFGRLVGEAQFPGSGLGLANVRRIVERHGGRVWAEARPNEGATFRFTLPPPDADRASQAA